MKFFCFILAVLVSTVSSQDCVTYTFGEDYNEEFSVNSAVCSGLQTWEIGFYSDTNVVPPNIKSESFIYPSSSLSCTVSFVFPIDTAGFMEVAVYMESSNPDDQVIVIVQSVNEGGNDGVIGQGAITSTNGWNAVEITWLSPGVYQGYIALTGLASEGSIVLVDSFRYVPPNSEQQCLPYNEVETTTDSLLTTTPALATNTEPVETTTEPADSTTEPTDSTTESVDSTSGPIDSTTEPVDSTTEPIDSTTESFDTTTELVDSTTEQIESTTELVDSTTEPIDSTTESFDTTTELVDSTTEPIDSTTESFDTTTELVDSSTEPIDSTTEPVDSTTEPIDSTTESFDTTTELVDSTTEPVDSTTEPTDSTTGPVDSTTESFDPTTETIEETTRPADSTTDEFENPLYTTTASYTESPLQSSSTDTFWTPLTISAITLLCSIVFSLICWYCYEYGAVMARRALPPIILEEDIEKLPRPLTVPRVTKVYADNRNAFNYGTQSIDKYPI